MAQIEEVAFPRLTSAELAMVKSMATARDYAEGDIVFRAGQAEIDLYVVESGRIEIQNPTDGHGVIVVHDPGQFSGDIDLLTGRPVIVTAVARGQTRLLCVPGSHWFGVNHNTKSTSRRLFRRQVGLGWLHNCAIYRQSFHPGLGQFIEDVRGVCSHQPPGYGVWRPPLNLAADKIVERRADQSVVVASRLDHYRHADLTRRFGSQHRHFCLYLGHREERS